MLHIDTHIIKINNHCIREAYREEGGYLQGLDYDYVEIFIDGAKVYEADNDFDLARFRAWLRLLRKDPIEVKE